MPVKMIKSSHESQGPFVFIEEADFDATKHELYLPPPPPFIAPALPPLPGPPADPLDNLAADWRERDDLKKLAAAVSGGRSVENKAQAIAVIEAELAKRAAA